MSLQDHPALITIAACAATAASTWAVSEQVRVTSLKERVSVQAEKNKFAPVVSDVKLTKIDDNGTQVIE